MKIGQSFSQLNEPRNLNDSLRIPSKSIQPIYILQAQEILLCQ